MSFRKQTGVDRDRWAVWSVVCAIAFCASAHAQGPIDVTETWTAAGTAGWSNNSSEVTLSNPGGYLEMTFASQGWPHNVSDTVGKEVSAGTRLINISLRFIAAEVAPSALALHLHSRASGRNWSVALSPPAPGGWTTYEAPVAYSAGWTTGPGSTEEQFEKDMLAVDWMGVYVRRRGQTFAQHYGIDDFRIQGGEISFITVTEPDMTATGGAGKSLTISWNGLWPLGEADVALHQGTNVWPLANRLSSPTSNMTWQATLPTDIEYATDYYVRVSASGQPYDYGYSDYFVVNFVNVTDITEVYLRPETRRVNRQTGTVFAMLHIRNLPDSGKRLQGDFWFAVRPTTECFLINPDGRLANGQDYVDVTAAVKAAMLATYGREYLDPGEEIDVCEIEFYSRDRTVPVGSLYVLWADPEPPNPDRDGDGMPNGWEIAHRLNPDWAGDAPLDSDGDGMKNRAEYAVGTDPNDPNSVFKARVVPDRAAAGGMRVGWPSATNRTYSVWRSTNLLDGFNRIKPGIPATPPFNYFEDTNAPGLGPYFYKIELESGP